MDLSLVGRLNRNGLQIYDFFIIWPKIWLFFRDIFGAKDSNKKCNGILLTLPQGKAARQGG